MELVCPHGLPWGSALGSVSFYYLKLPIDHMLTLPLPASPQACGCLELSPLIPQLI